MNFAINSGGSARREADRPSGPHRNRSNFVTVLFTSKITIPISIFYVAAAAFQGAITIWLSSLTV